MSVTIALFDLGRVVLDWEPSRLYDKIFADPTERDWFLANVCTMDWHTQNDCGASFAETTPPLIDKFPQYEHAIRAWSGRWMEMFDGYVDGVPELMDRLQARQVPLYALSNMTSETWPWHLEAFPKLAMFRDVIVSGDVKLVKPDPAIYRLTLERMGNPAPEDVIFIDDSAVNIEAASRLGFRTHHFSGSHGLERALLETGLL